MGIRTWKLALTGLVCMATLSGGAVAKEWSAFGNEVSIALGKLPEQGQTTYRLIHQGGPFPFEKDGVVFGNRERLLPQRKRGYYHEYTVKTPRSWDRGVQRMVCGGAVSTPDICYYSDDHYASFRKIVP